MDLFLGFDIFGQFCHLAKCFVKICKTYKYAKLKPSSLQNYILHNGKLVKSPMSPTPKNSNVEEPDITF